MVDYFSMQKAIRATKEDSIESIDRFARQSDLEPWHESTHRVDEVL